MRRSIEYPCQRFLDRRLSHTKVQTVCCYAAALFAILWVGEAAYCGDVDVTLHFLLGISPDRGAGLHYISVIMWFVGALALSAWAAGELSIQVTPAKAIRRRLHDSTRLLRTDNFMFVALVLIGSVFAFEVPYTILYDAAHRAAFTTGHFWLSFNQWTIPRNIGFLCLGLLPVAIARFYQLPLRFDKVWLLLTAGVYLAWLFWYFAPFPFQVVEGPFFPQTIYNYYGGFGDFLGSQYVPNHAVWATNFLLVKPLATAWFFYPFFFMVTPHA